MKRSGPSLKTALLPILWEQAGWESIHAFEALDLDIGLERILKRRVPEPLFDLPCSDEVDARLPVIAGGLSLTVARTFKIMDPQTKHPATEQWERAFQIFDLLL